MGTAQNSQFKGPGRASSFNRPWPRDALRSIGGWSRIPSLINAGNVSRGLSSISVAVVRRLEKHNRFLSDPDLAQPGPV